MKKYFVPIFIAVMMVSSLALGVSFFSSEDESSQLCSGEDCLACTAAALVNDLPDPDDITIENAAAVMEQINQIDRMKSQLDTETPDDEGMTEYDHFIAQVEGQDPSGDSDGDSENGPDSESRSDSEKNIEESIPKYDDVLTDIEQVEGGSFAAVSKAVRGVPAEQLDWSQTDATFSIECIETTNENVTFNSGKPLEVTLGEIQGGSMEANGLYAKKSNGWTNKYLLPEGTYKITEIGSNTVTVNGTRLNTTASYNVDGKKSADYATFSVAAGQTSSVLASNIKAQTFLAVDEESNALEGATIQIYDESSLVAEWISNEHPQAIETFKLTPNIEYTITAAKAGYYFDCNNPTFSINSNGIINTANGSLNAADETVLLPFKKTQVSFSAIDASNENSPLPGAEIQILKDGTPVDGCTWISANEAKAIEGLEVGTEYTIKVTENTPAGYGFDVNEPSFTISTDGKITVSDGLDVTEGVIYLPFKSTTNDGGAAVLAPTEQESQGLSVSFQAVDEDGIALEGAVIQILNEDGQVSIDRDSIDIAPDGIMSVNGLAANTVYTVRADVLPTGYFFDDHTFKIDADGTFVSENGLTATNGVVKLPFKKTQVSFSAVDEEGTALDLSNIVINIKDASEPNNVVVDSLKLGSGNTVEGLLSVATDYTIAVTAPPEGYSFDYDNLTFRIGYDGAATFGGSKAANNEIQLPFTAIPKETGKSVSFHAVDKNNPSIVPGDVTIKIKDEFGNEVEAGTSTDGEITVDGLLAGTYIIEIITPPTGYEFAGSDNPTFTINADGSITSTTLSVNGTVVQLPFKNTGNNDNTDTGDGIITPGGTTPGGNEGEGGGSNDGGEGGSTTEPSGGNDPDADDDGDGIPNASDNDNDDDGTPDYKDNDMDSDGDGTPDVTDDDNDGDGTLDVTDTDDDGDGIPDTHDPDHQSFYDTDEDGDIDSNDKDRDTDNDGIPDVIDDDDDGNGTKDYADDNVDDDNDGIPNWKDTDDDNDGIPDLTDDDDDGDKIPDKYDPDADSDNDGIPDIRDTNSDEGNTTPFDNGDGDKPHTHTYKELVKEKAKKSDATCTKAAVYYKSCECGAISKTATFTYGKPAGHQGTKATCTEKAYCTVCKTYYGDALGHKWSAWKKQDGTYHIRKCTRDGCGHAELKAHSPDLVCGSDAESCTVCGATAASEHKFDMKKWKSNATKHWHECIYCGEKKDTAKHDFNKNVGSDVPQTCPTCKYGGHITRVTPGAFDDEDIPESLRAVYKTVDEIKGAMKTKASKMKLKAEGSELYDAILEYSVDGGITWYKASKSYFPKDGMLPVKMEVPAGTNLEEHNYMVLHMFSSNAFGKNAGDIETPEVLEVKGTDGKQYISFYVTGLSPIMVAWEEAPDVEIDIADDEKAAGMSLGDGTDTGDDSNMLPWVILAIASSLAGAATLLYRRRRA